MSTSDGLAYIGNVGNCFAEAALRDLWPVCAGGESDLTGIATIGS